MTFERSVIGNGLRVLAAPMPEARSVTCMIMVAAGSRYETHESNGIAHFTEHMFFKGTERRPSARDIAGEVDAIGGEFNAFTGKEYTGYYVRCAAESHSVALDVLVDMIRHSKFDPDEIEREKGVIVEEMNMYFDSPRDYVGSIYERLLFGDQPLGWDVIGGKETVRAATRDTFLDYLGRWYVPSRMVVGLGGRLNGDTLAEIEALLGDLAPAETGKPAAAEISATDGPSLSVHYKKSDQAHLVLGTLSQPQQHPDRYVLQVLAAILGGGMSSRLFTEVRERRGLAYYVFCQNNAYAETGTLCAQAGVDLNRVEQAIETIVAELRHIVSEPVPSEELTKAKEYSKGRLVLQLESPQGLISFGLRREVLEGVAVDPAEVIAGIDAVDAGDIQRVAREVIGERALHLALIGPFEDGERFARLLD
ncbi:MAG: pitrilysin family protein [Gaiellaceae bacterium]